MNEEQRTKLQELIDAAQLADHEWCESRITEASNQMLDQAEQAVHSYVDSLLGEKDAEIMRLQTRLRNIKLLVESPLDTEDERHVHMRIRKVTRPPMVIFDDE